MLRTWNDLSKEEKATAIFRNTPELIRRLTLKDTPKDILIEMHKKSFIKDVLNTGMYRFDKDLCIV